MAIAFASNKVGPHIVPDGTVLKMFDRRVLGLDAATLAGMAALEQQTLASGAASFATPVDGRPYVFVWGSGATAKMVMLGNATANQTAADAAGSGATPQTWRVARLADASVVQT
jgi:hypothetical protein